ncbi:MAG: DUF4296 domain-containing protein [candidate division KSB1 bacterium]|nr:DUF4296 domain-containing protein [candidate division KSB1 bacterium]MDZ7303509.1 DUF4296 domain-containing protein [candidate division KSB1 bacterium]MDZ7312689.1 DUF4296 domain-containing protein [candidate division KSB1 bacterium]
MSNKSGFDLTRSRPCLTAFILLSALLGCDSKPSNPLQKPERFAEVYAKVLIATEVDADSTLSNSDHAAARFARADSSLRALGYNRQQFESAVKYFGEHPERWQKVYSQVVKILEEQTNVAEDKKD